MARAQPRGDKRVPDVEGVLGLDVVTERGVDSIRNVSVGAGATRQLAGGRGVRSLDSIRRERHCVLEREVVLVRGAAAVDADVDPR